MITARRYKQTDAPSWDDFIQKSRNGTFLFSRQFMDYHNDRFQDHSLIFEEKNKIVAVLPANEQADQKLIQSHGGLTYGGLVMSDQLTQERVFNVFREIDLEYGNAGFEKLIYKTVPSFYARCPSEEDRYVLHQIGATVIRRDVTTVVDLQQKLPFQERRRRAIKKAFKTPNIIFQPSHNWDEFWVLLTQQLQNRYDTTPVHSVDEIKLLNDRFPEKISLNVASRQDQIEAGLVLFDCGPTLHVQYSASSEFARDNGLLDALIDTTISNAKLSHRFFDFGISTEDQGRELNTQLIQYKEGFGGRSVVHDFYQIDLRSANQAGHSE